MRYHNWQARQQEFKLVSNRKAKKVVSGYLKPGMKLLDVGCGDCDFFDSLKKNGYSGDFHVFDVQEGALAIAKTKGYTPHSSLNIKEQFDVVTMFEVLEHLTMDERVAYAATFDKMIKKGGYLILSFPHIKSFLSVVTYFDNLDHKTPYPKPMGLKYLFENFEQVNLFHFTPYINPIRVMHCLFTGLHWNAVYNNVGVVLKKVK